MFSGQPAALRVLFLTEAWERFSYYGMRSLLVLYMTQALGWSVPTAALVYGLYTGAIYFTPIVGGWLADRYLGPPRAILLGTGLMAAGHFALALPGLLAFAAGLSLLGLGSGLFKPCVSVLVGRLYGDDDPLREAGFSLFYMGINLGALLAPLVCGTLGQTLGFHWGFASAGGGMLVAGLTFARQYPRHGAQGADEPERAAPRQRASPVGRVTGPPLALWRRVAVLGALAVFGNVAFWAAFEQAGSSIELFADRYVDLRVAWLGNANLSTLVQAINPICILVLAPLFASLWRRLHERGWEPEAPAKFVVGLGLCALSFFWLSHLGGVADRGGRVSLAALAVSTVLSTCAELCISPVGLSLVSRLAPRRLVSAAMGLWMGSIALANVGSGTFASQFDAMPHAEFFGRIAWACCAVGVLLALLCPWLTSALSGRGRASA
jgi:POT family proton-dependent oligopeptide transporter